MLTAKRFSNIPNSPIVEAMQRAEDLKLEGHKIISLTAGQPDFKTPKHVISAAKAAMDRGETQYTCETGTLEVRKAVCAKFKRDNNVEYTPDQVIVSSGGKQIITNTLMAVLDDGDEVIIPSPYWTSYPNMVRINRGVPVITEHNEKQKITPRLLEKSITERTKLLFLNSPSNPTGVVYSEQELKELSRVLLKYPNILILSDDVYEHSVYDGKFVTLAQVEPKLYDRTITMNSVSKSYYMTGWRIGYAGANREIIETMGKIQAQTTMHPSSISQAAAIAALTGPQDFLKTNLHILRLKRDLICGLLNKIQGISCPTPSSTFYAYPSVDELIGLQTPSGKMLQNDTGVMYYFLEEAGVATVQGEAFGCSPHLRICFSHSFDLLIEACEKINEACMKLK